MIHAQESFPKSWLGEYKGELMIYGVDSVKMKIDMELKIGKTSNDSIYDWTIIYDFKGKSDVRAYSLIVSDQQKGHYKIDERNSIIIDAYMHNDSVFTSFFKVEESVIIATYSKMGDSIFFEIISSKSAPVSKTGNSSYKEEEIPEVFSFEVNGRQNALLKKSH